MGAPVRVESGRPVRYVGPAIAAGAYLCYVVYSLSRWRQHRVSGLDLGIFDQVVRNYAFLRPPVASIKGAGFNIWGDHFHPILVLLAPLYRIWDDARVLLIAQAALVAISVWIVHRFAARHLSPRAAALAAVAYALGWPIQNLIDFDFHEIAFALPLLAAAIDALDRGSDRALLWSSLALLLVREDMGFVVFVLGLIRVWRRPRFPGALLLVAGPVTFLVVTQVVMARFGGFGYWTYQALGPDLPSAVLFIVAHPITTLGLALTPGVKVEKLLWLLLPLALLPLRSRYALLALPLLAQMVLSSRQDLWGTKWHHSSVLWPVLFLAAIDGAVRLRLPDRRRLWTAVQVVIVAIPLLGTLMNPVVFPLHRLVDGSAFELSSGQRDETSVLRAVPPETCVEADDWLTVFLTHTNLVSTRGTLGRPPDFYLIDLDKGLMHGVPSRVVQDQAIAAGYVQVAGRGSVVLLQRPGYRGPTAECAPG